MMTAYNVLPVDVTTAGVRRQRAHLTKCGVVDGALPPPAAVVLFRVLSVVLDIPAEMEMRSMRK